MDLSFLESLIHVVERGSIAEAARVQRLTSAAVRQRVNALERELGLSLLRRSGQTCLPTPACDALLPRAKHLVREGEMLRDDADATGLSGTLRIGAISTALTGLMPEALRALAINAPKLVPFLKPGTSSELYDAVLAGEIDAAITVAPPFATPKTIAMKTLRREPLVFINKRASNESIKQQLMRHAYIRYDAAAWGGRFAQQYVIDQKLQPQLLCDLDGLEAITMMVAEGLGVSLIPRWHGLAEFASRVKISPINGVKYQREIVLITRQQNAHAPKLKLLASLLESSRAARGSNQRSK
ncbi:MAG: LysR substrate-binding domain-containing protein [Casimicrobium sp.]